MPEPTACGGAGGGTWDGASYGLTLGGNGGSGIVIVRYVTAGSLSAYEQWRRVHFTTDQLTDSVIGGDAADPDGDGMNNTNEYYAGTIPTNGASGLIMYAPVVNPGSFSNFVIHWQSASNRWYTVQAATNLLTGFAPIPGASNLPATYPVNVYTDDTANVGMKFYRIKARE